MRSYKMKLDHHYYYFNTKLSSQMMQDIEHQLQERLDSQDKTLSSHQKIVSALVMTTYELIQEREKNKHLVQQLNQSSSSSYDYDVILHDLQQEMNDVLKQAKEKNESETMLAARHVLNHISKQQIKRKKPL